MEDRGIESVGDALGVLVIAGLADPCGDIGSQGRYGLLSIPWEWDRFKCGISHAVKADKGTATVEGINPAVQFVGVRCWICISREAKYPLLRLMRGEGAETVRQQAAEVINHLSLADHEASIAWPIADPDDDGAIGELEQRLLQLLK